MSISPAILLEYEAVRSIFVAAVKAVLGEDVWDLITGNIGEAANRLNSLIEEIQTAKRCFELYLMRAYFENEFNIAEDLL